VNSAEGLKDEEAGVLDEVLQASNQEEVVHENLGDREHVASERREYQTVISARLQVGLTVRLMAFGGLSEAKRGGQLFRDSFGQSRWALPIERQRSHECGNTSPSLGLCVLLV